MSISQTGHAEIDQQHEILDAMVAQLQRLCVAAKLTHEPSCSQCGVEQVHQCQLVLSTSVKELGAFLVGHATYEERMMELLPDTPTCQAHIKAHKAAHQGVAKQLKKLATQVACEVPLVGSQAIWQIIGDWLGDHTSLFDNRLVRMARSNLPEINYDNELVVMLDRHVFPNRPTPTKSANDGSQALQKAKTATRGQFESLTPAQKNVFWLAAGGKKNREIAEALKITTNTVKTHRAVVFQKMDVTSVVELIKKTDLLR